MLKYNNILHIFFLSTSHSNPYNPILKYPLKSGDTSRTTRAPNSTNHRVKYSIRQKVKYNQHHILTHVI